MEMEIREEELMYSPLGGDPCLRIAHFLIPCSKIIENPECDDLPSTLFSGTAISQPQMLPLQIRFIGWLHPQEQWSIWEERLRSKYEHAWRKAGILEAIRASTYRIERSNDLVLGLAHKWYSQTNSFIFSWGEATITLEDMMVCGGYSVVGSSVFTPLEDKESKRMEQRLDEVRRKLIKTKAKKAGHLPWLKYFMEEEGELEHVAFLSLWLSRFVFPHIISKQIFPIAIHLARGVRITLAPAVLSSIYRDLTLLKTKIDETAQFGTSKNDEYDKPIFLRAPLQLVQIWAFERFPSFHLKCNITEYAQPMIAKWHKVKMMNYENVSLVLDSCSESFFWRPYKDCPKFYNERDKWVCFNSDSHMDLESFARCLRHSELVGIDCIEKYLPHRVAMQFGLDQDIPEKVAHRNENDPMIAWRNYDRPMTGTMLCIAAAASYSTLEPGVTSKYLEWWNRSKLGLEVKPSTCSKPISISEDLSQASFEMGSNIQRDQTGDSARDDGSDVVKELKKGSHSHEIDISMAKSEDVNVVGGSKRAKLNTNIEVVIGSHIHGDQTGDSVKDDGLTVKELKKRSHSHETDISMTDGDENLAKSENMNVVGGLKRAKLDAEMEVVIGKSERAKEGKNGDNGKEGEWARNCNMDIYFSDLETRIEKLERLVPKLKAAKFGYKSGDLRPYLVYHSNDTFVCKNYVEICLSIVTMMVLYKHHLIITWLRSTFLPLSTSLKHSQKLSLMIFNGRTIDSEGSPNLLQLSPIRITE